MPLRSEKYVSIMHVIECLTWNLLENKTPLMTVLPGSCGLW